MVRKLVFAFLICSSFIFSSPGFAQDEKEELSEIVVTADRVANTQPAGTFATTATQLRYEPLTELQSRGLPEGQADVTVRGGVFENTGFRVDAVTVMDPQTGHYVAELPLDPDAMSAPIILTGIDNAVAGFNSNIATVNYALRKIVEQGSVSLGIGNDNLQFQSLRIAGTFALHEGADLGVAMSASRSEGDGTIADGDHEFERINAQLQRSDANRQSDLILSFQDKFYAWPGAYTGFASLPETDRTKTTLLLANHREEIDTGYWQLGAFFRRLEDDYDFDRRTQESGEAGSFDHETKVYGVGFDGEVRGNRLTWRYGGQISSDELVSSTDLTEGDFDSRTYTSMSVVPSFDFAQTGDRVATLQFGASVDWSNRDSSKVSPLLGVTVRKNSGGKSHYIAVDYAGTSQLPGYTVLKSRPSGLFGGNADLGRELARHVSLSVGTEADGWDASATLFLREDEDLVDWTFESGSPFSRQANAVDIDVFGAELFGRWQWDKLLLVGSYTYLDKDADYGDAVVDASFYALNFATHRATLAARYTFNERLELRWDNEYRKQRRNALRSNGDNAFHSAVSLAWEPQGASGFGFAASVDNLTDDDYQQFPGTPAVGRQFSVSARYAW